MSLWYVVQYYEHFLGNDYCKRLDMHVGVSLATCNVNFCLLSHITTCMCSVRSQFINQKGTAVLYCIGLSSDRKLCLEHADAEVRNL